MCNSVTRSDGRFERAAGRTGAVGAVAVPVIGARHAGDEGFRHDRVVSEVWVGQKQAGVEHRDLDALAAVISPCSSPLGAT